MEASLQLMEEEEEEEGDLSVTKLSLLSFSLSCLKFDEAAGLLLLLSHLEPTRQ